MPSPFHDDPLASLAWADRKPAALLSGTWCKLVFRRIGLCRQAERQFSHQKNALNLRQSFGSVIYLSNNSMIDYGSVSKIIKESLISLAIILFLDGKPALTSADAQIFLGHYDSLFQWRKRAYIFQETYQSLLFQGPGFYFYGFAYTNPPIPIFTSSHIY